METVIVHLKESGSLESIRSLGGKSKLLEYLEVTLKTTRLGD